MLTTKGIFHRKINDFEPKTCVIEKVISLTAQDYDAFSQNMIMDEYDFIKDTQDMQYTDENGIYHCILVTGEERNDGILVLGKGYDYARYAAFMPNVSDFLAAAMEQEQSTEKKTTVPGFKLKDLMAVPQEDIHLVHSDEDIELATISELKNTTLTDAGRKEWADILNADVHRLFSGAYGLQIEVSGVNPQRLSDFSYMLAGYCSAEDFKKWVTQEPEAALDDNDNELQPDHHKIKVLMVEPKKLPYIAEIDNNLNSQQKIIGGKLEEVCLEPGVVLICNKEDKLIKLEGNRAIGNDIIVDNFFIAGVNEEGNFISLTREQIQEYMQKFLTPESFTKEQIDEISGITFKLF